MGGTPDNSSSSSEVSISFESMSKAMDLAATPNRMLEMLEMYKNRAFIDIIALSSLVHEKVKLAMLEPDKMDAHSAMDLMRKAAVMADDIISGRLVITSHQVDKEPEVGNEYVPTSEDADKAYDAIFEMVSADVPPKPRMSHEYVPSARKKPPQKPVEENLEGQLNADTPHKTTENKADSKRANSTTRIVKIRKTPRPSS